MSSVVNPDTIASSNPAFTRVARVPPNRGEVTSTAHWFRPHDDCDHSFHQNIECKFAGEFVFRIPSAAIFCTNRGAASADGSKLKAPGSTSTHSGPGPRREVIGFKDKDVLRARLHPPIETCGRVFVQTYYQDCPARHLDLAVVVLFRNGDGIRHCVGMVSQASSTAHIVESMPHWP